MKRNYYTIHKNKKPKSINRKRKGYISTTVPETIVLGVVGASVVRHLNYSFLSVEEKKKKIAETLINTASAIANNLKNEKVKRFKATGRYIK